MWDYYACDGYQDLRTRPFGLLGLLAKYLDPTLPEEVLHVIINTLGEKVFSNGRRELRYCTPRNFLTRHLDQVTEDVFIALDLIPKLVNVAMKSIRSTNMGVKHVLFHFRPSSTLILPDKERSNGIV